MDTISREARSRLMSKIRGKDTGPEMVVRRLAHSLGFRFRLHVAGLPGSPDIVFPSRKKVIFINGCFWHDHKCKVAGRSPQTRRQYWQAKFARNRNRDRQVRRRLRNLGWRVLTVWECQTRNVDRLAAVLRAFLA
ncbi:MAG TPA: very short patch repair endonuclease [Phycisphaerales bacterium]|nr:very short patch repair endonuclease [Phycisphaerales bacterium]